MASSVVLEASTLETDRDSSSEASSPSRPHSTSPSVTKATVSQPALPGPPPGHLRAPICIGHLGRYDRKYTIPKQNTISVIPPMTTHFPHSTEGGCGNWVPVTHPEGGLYFYDHIFTDIYVYDSFLAEEAEQFIAHLDEMLKSQSKPLPPNYELVLEVRPWETGDMFWGYYYIDHDTRSQFWLEDFDCVYLTRELSASMQWRINIGEPTSAVSVTVPDVSLVHGEGPIGRFSLLDLVNFQ
ncbi:hypothetical protein EWM64_g2616 [Hericium alpestre]|uniref:WW domain-containing protein n=1 Tax=Hericium alpestre TaxID=135208 RepID=A0A4Z0A6W2_9AGAM|nr:hypothetical protein EWM64_g2616 [Hericium alpestre]